MYRIIFLLLLGSCKVVAQPASLEFNPAETKRIITTLAADDMRGRRAGTPDIERAADFVAAEFAKACLKPLKENNFRQAFSLVQAHLKELKYKADDADADIKSVYIQTHQKEIELDETSGYEVSTIGASDNFMTMVRKTLGAPTNTITYIDDSHAAMFRRLQAANRPGFKSEHSHVFVLGTQLQRFKLKASFDIELLPYANVVGMLPGKSRKDEYVIFSAHYDHIGVGKPVNGDSIYNGANDNAAGTTAVIQLARYFAQKGDNERTLLFVAFTAEETEGWGSQYFSHQLPPEKIAAMLNIEMIGTDSRWGKNAAYITGFDKSDLGTILQKNLEGSAFKFHPDPYPEQNLFYRSDNATLARLGVPAHTISTAKMEGEPNYHKVTDEVTTLDLENMAAIIQAIALSSQSIIAGKDSPSRVQAASLR